MNASEILVRRGLLNSSQVEQIRQADGSCGWENAVEAGLVSEEDALRAMGDEFGMDFIDLAGEDTDVDLSLLEVFPQKLIYRQSLFPIRRDNGSLVVATSDPFDLYPLDEAGAATAAEAPPRGSPTAAAPAKPARKKRRR